MTDAEIIKALQENIHLAEYVDSDYCSNIELSLIKAALDLINRQKAEIERLTINMNAFGLGMIREKERADTARAEAIKEFAERFESKLNCIPQHHFTLAQVLFDLDKTKKEMAGDTE